MARLPRLRIALPVAVAVAAVAVGGTFAFADTTPAAKPLISVQCHGTDIEVTVSALLPDEPTTVKASIVELVPTKNDSHDDYYWHDMEFGASGDQNQPNLYLGSGLYTPVRPSADESTGLPNSVHVVVDVTDSAHPDGPYKLVSDWATVPTAAECQ